MSDDVNERELHALDRQESSGSGFWIWVAIFVVMSPFLIIVTAFVEYKTLGTNHVEDLCRTIGIHGFIGDLINLLDIDF